MSRPGKAIDSGVTAARHAADVSSWSVPRLLMERAATHRDRDFVQEFGGRSQTYGATLEAARRIGCGLQQLGVSAGDMVLVMVGNRLEAINLWLGINLLGATEVAINTGYIGNSFEHAVNLCRAATIVIEEVHLPVLRASIRALPHLKSVVVLGDRAGMSDLPGMEVRSYAELAAQDHGEDFAGPRHFDTASVIYTSGTTGPAKGVMMPHAQVMLIARMTADAMRMTDADVFYNFTPLYHMAAKFMGALGTMHAGAKLVLDKSFSPGEWIGRVRTCGATVSGGPGTLVQMIHDTDPAPDDRHHRLTRIYGAPIPKHIAAAFQQRFGVKGIELWGMTEVGDPCWSPYGEPLREGSCGKVDDRWYELAIVDPDTDRMLPPGETGEILVRPKAPWICMKGYMGMPEKTVEAWRNLWFHTGDLAYADAEGYVYFVARASERIRRRSENISSYEIELAALRHPAIREAAAVGVESDYPGDDDIKLCVVGNPGQELDPMHLTEHLAALLPHYMVPRYIEVLPELPRTPTSKLQRVLMKKPAPEGRLWDRKRAGVSLRQMVEGMR
jgi:crotonobetaine/carnitine-CoA ligase